MSILCSCKIVISIRNVPIQYAGFASLLKYLGLIVYASTKCKIEKIEGY